MAIVYIYIYVYTYIYIYIWVNSNDLLDFLIGRVPFMTIGGVPPN